MIRLRHPALTTTFTVAVALASLAPHAAHASRQGKGLGVASAAAAALAAVECPSIRYSERRAARDVALWAGITDAALTGAQERAMRALFRQVRPQIVGMDRRQLCSMGRTFLRETERRR